MYSIKDTVPVLNAIAKESRLECDELRQLCALTAQKYVVKGTEIYVEDAWTWGKLKDGADAADRARVLGRKFVFAPKIIHALEFIAFSADIGRLIVRNNQYHRHESALNQEVHGAASAAYLHELELTHQVNVSDPLFAAMRTAIRYHSDQNYPTLADVGDSVATYHMCLLLRDLDKAGNWIGSGAQYVTPRKIELESKTNNVADEPYARAVIVDAFAQGEMINRAVCKTYIEYMLQFLAWGYDFAFIETWQEVVESQQPQLVLSWIQQRLLSNQQTESWERIHHAAHTRLGITPI